MGTSKGFIKDWSGNKILPITRGELVLDQDGNIALNSKYFLAGQNGAAYGLVTAAERAMLSGGGVGGTGSIGDLANKLNYINTGLSFNNTTLNFYNDSGTATPIKIIADATNGITLNAQNNNVFLSLVPLTQTETTISQVIKNITVDTYGRVISISGGQLTNEDLPQVIHQKVISEGLLTNCTTQEKEIPNNELAVVNKAYVDQKLLEIGGVATGSLKFGGPIQNASEVENCLISPEHWNTYYKITSQFILSTDNFYETSGITGDSINTKVGDTIIIYPVDGVSKIVYVPSGDDITAITVRGQNESSPALSNKIGNVTLNFSPVFSVKNYPENSNTALITLPQASSTLDGYLSSTDYIEFKSNKPSYENKLTAQVGLYDIGILKIGETSYTIRGINNVSELTLNNGAQSEFNPILKFKETGYDDVDITLQGYNGIFIKKDGNSIRISSEIETTSQKYLTIDSENKLKVVIGNVDLNQHIVNDGLVDFTTFYNFMIQLSDTTVFEKIDYSLIGTDSTKYQYGNELLREAIDVTI